jgi:hypothetical protein
MARAGPTRLPSGRRLQADRAARCQLPRPSCFFAPADSSELVPLRVSDVSSRDAGAAAVVAQPVADDTRVGACVGLVVEVELHQHQQAVHAFAVAEPAHARFEPALDVFELGVEPADGGRVHGAAARRRTAPHLVLDELSVLLDPAPHVGRLRAVAVGLDAEVFPPVAVDEGAVERTPNAGVAVQLGLGEVVAQRLLEVPLGAVVLSLRPKELGSLDGARPAVGDDALRYAVEAAEEVEPALR